MNCSGGENLLSPNPYSSEGQNLETNECQPKQSGKLSQGVVDDCGNVRTVSNL